MPLFCLLFTVSDVKSENDKLHDSEAVDEWDELYQCAFCEEVFTNSSDLTEHREAHHELNEE